MSFLDDIKEGDQIVVEICQKSSSTVAQPDLVHSVQQFLLQYDIQSSLNQSLQSNSFLAEHVQHLHLWDSKERSLSFQQQMQIKQEQLCCHVFHLHSGPPEDEMLDDEQESLPAASHLLLPSEHTDNIWETLIYDSEIKENLLSYAKTGLLFSDKGINENIICWNRVILLHGPPGTGKTSLCHALAHKLSIRLSDRFYSTSLLEVNSHSLFSKWFSESGKLVMKMFRKVEELVEDEHHLVCLLIDEVESLTAARSAVASGTEPSDAIRVVNALLTQIDQLKKYKNVLILATSNVTGKIDLAFVDRADIKFYVGLPAPEAIYTIFRSCLEELQRVGIIAPKDPLLRDPTVFRHSTEICGKNNPSQWLWQIAKESVGLSGRTLRKLPFLAHARFLHTSHSVSLGRFLDALSKAIQIQFAERQNLSDT